jgi:hypothetical protein
MFHSPRLWRRTSIYSVGIKLKASNEPIATNGLKVLSFVISLKRNKKMKERRIDNSSGATCSLIHNVSQTLPISMKYAESMN